MDENEQRAADIALLRDQLWEEGSTVVDFLILHDCPIRDVAMANCRLLGWTPEQFVMAWLADDRSMLDG